DPEDVCGSATLVPRTRSSPNIAARWWRTSESGHWRNRSQRQLCAGLLRHHVGRVPVRPVRVALTGAPLMLAVGSFRAPHRACQTRRRREYHLGGVDPPGQPRRDLLQQPAVAVRVAECGVGAIGGVIGRRAAHPAARAFGLKLSARRAGVEYLADLAAARDERL